MRLDLETNGVYIHCAKGSVEVGEEKLKAGDAVGIYETTHVNIQSTEDAELIFVEVPLHRGIRLHPNKNKSFLLQTA